MTPEERVKAVAVLVDMREQIRTYLALPEVERVFERAPKASAEWAAAVIDVLFDLSAEVGRP